MRRTGLKEDLRRIGELCRDHEVEEIVLGYPVNMNGTVGEAAREAERFKTSLEQEWGKTVHLQDERLTTSAAEKVLLEGDVSRRKRKKARDKLAASMILESFLRSRDQ